MPSRFVSLAILIYWSIAAFLLLTWDVLPELTLGYAPDLRAIALAGDSSRPVRWSDSDRGRPATSGRAEDGGRIGHGLVPASRRLVGADKPRRPRCRRAAQKAFRSEARSNEHVTVESLYLVDHSGNLNSFVLTVAAKKSGERLKVTGQLKGKKMEIVTTGPVPDTQSEPVARLRAAERG